MISILIPVYDRNVVPLVMALQQQALAVKEQVEIIVMDDGSPDKISKCENRTALFGIRGVQYIELTANVGRNIIRGQLATIAKYDNLLFLDDDSSLPDARWLQRYVNAAHANTDGAIIIGGRLYRTPVDYKSSLHFRYGRAKEEIQAARRNRHPYRFFLACNLLIPKAVFLLLQTDPKLHGYGHEDLFMGLQAEKLKIQVLHIDNPVYHDGIDSDQLFMQKQQEALENLYYLYQKYRQQYNFNARVKLIRAYNRMAGTAAGKYILNKLSGSENKLKEKLLGTHRLFWLDCWKLVQYDRLSRHDRT